VLINGTQVPDQLRTSFAAAGGKNIAIVKSFNLNSQQLRAITIQFHQRSCGICPKHKRIEIKTLDRLLPPTTIEG